VVHEFLSEVLGPEVPAGVASGEQPAVVPAGDARDAGPGKVLADQSVQDRGHLARRWGSWGGDPVSVGESTRWQRGMRAAEWCSKSAGGVLQCEPEVLLDRGGARRHRRGGGAAVSDTPRRAWTVPCAHPRGPLRPGLTGCWLTDRGRRQVRSRSTPGPVPRRRHLRARRRHWEDLTGETRRARS